MLCSCFQPSGLSTLQAVGPQCSSMARATANLSDTAKENGEKAIEYTQQVKTLLKTIGSGGLNASTFCSIQKLVESRDSLNFVTKMDEVASEMVSKTDELTKSLEESVNSMPKNAKEDVESEEDEEEKTRDVDGGEDAIALTEFLENSDADVDEVDVQARGLLDDVDIFTVGQRGRDAFEKVGNTENIAVKIFNEIKSVASTIAAVAVAFTTGGCCAQFEALASGIRNLMKCLSLSKLIQKALAFVKRLLKAAIEFIQMAWDKFSGFLEQFDAAKRLERFSGHVKSNVLSGVGKTGFVRFVKNAAGNVLSLGDDNDRDDDSSSKDGGMLDNFTGNAFTGDFVKNTTDMLKPQKKDQDRPAQEESGNEAVIDESNIHDALTGTDCCGVLSTLPKLR